MRVDGVGVAPERYRPGGSSGFDGAREKDTAKPLFPRPCYKEHPDDVRSTCLVCGMIDGGARADFEVG